MIRKVKNSKLNTFHYINVSILFIALCLPFIAGSLSKEGQQEKLSTYIANRVMDSTTSSTEMAITVSEALDSGPIPGSDDEFLKTYGTFKQTKTTFFSGYNIHKKQEVTINEINQGNLAIIYTGADMSFEYNGHYRQWTYPFELMFSTHRLYDISPYMIYISKSQADIFLSQLIGETNFDNYTLSDYESLIRRTFMMEVNGESFKCVIGNIFYEYNNYYSAIKEVVGDFVLCAYYNPTGFNRENVYFFNSYSFENLYFMDYINSTYSNKKYCVEVVEHNITGDVDVDYITSFYYASFKTNYLPFYSLIILSIFFISLVCFLNFLKCYEVHFFYVLLNATSFLFPYIVFLIVNYFVPVEMYFSNYGIKLYVYLLLYYIVGNIVLYIVNNILKAYQKRKSIVCRH